MAIDCAARRAHDPAVPLANGREQFLLAFAPSHGAAAGLALTFTWGLGGIALLLFMILVLTGILLTFYYVPHVDRAYESMKDLQFAVPFGVFLRNVHRWSATRWCWS